MSERNFEWNTKNYYTAKELSEFLGVLKKRIDW